jgi:hypothetical protein
LVVGEWSSLDEDGKDVVGVWSVTGAFDVSEVIA